MGKKHTDKVVHSEPTTVDHLGEPPKTRISREMKFDDLESFESYIKDETWDNEFDNMDLTLTYLPPFILHEIHDNEENIKPQMNSNSKKFRRNLQHHLQRHLIPDILKMSGIKYTFDKIGEELVLNEYGTSSKYQWHFKDESNHGFDEKEYEKREHWIVTLDVECNSENPFVTIKYKSESQH